MQKVNAVKKSIKKRVYLVRPAVRLLIGLQVLLVLVTLAAVLLIGKQMRGAVINYAQSHVSAQAQNTESLLTQSFSLLRLHLLALPISDPADENHFSNARESLNSLLRKLSYVRSLSILDEKGVVAHSTNPDNIGTLVDTHNYAPNAAWDVVGVLRYGNPLAGRDLYDSQKTVSSDAKNSGGIGFFPIAMRLPSIFGATVIATINSDYFINHVVSTDSIEGLQTKLYLDSGYLLFSTNPEDKLGSTFVSNTPLNNKPLWENANQSADSLVAHSESQVYPWFIQSKVPTSMVLEGWYNDVNKLRLTAVLLLLFMLLITGYMTRRVSSLLKNEENLYKQTAQAASVFTHSSDGITITDTNLNIIAANPAFEKITGYSESEVLGRTPRILASNKYNESFYHEMWLDIANKGVWQGRIIDKHKDGRLLTLVLTINAIKNPTGESLYVGVFKDISSGVEKEKLIRRLSQAVEQNPASIVITDMSGSIEYANPQFHRSTGYSKEEVIGVNPRILASGLTPPDRYTELWNALTNKKPWEGELINRRKNGTIYIERALMSPITDLDGKVTGYLGVKYDITKEKQTEHELKLSASVMANTLDGVLIADKDQNVIDVNPAFSAITGYKHAEIIGKPLKKLHSDQQDEDFYEKMMDSLMKVGHWQGEVWNRRKDGALYAALSNVTAVLDDAGQTSHYVSVFSDITQLKKHQKNLELLAHYDPLTRLPNRALLHDRLQIEIARAKRGETCLAVCFMDLDGFKIVNDTYGHEAGDELLIAVARRLETSVRSGDTAARLGGDEFVMLLGGIKSAEEYEKTANRILRAVAQPIPLRGNMVNVTGSMGITIYPSDNSESEQLMRHADHAMYQAKQAGRNRFVVYDPGSDAAAQRLIQSTDELLNALSNNEFRLYYQPKLDLRLRAVVGFEALIRWQHTENGLLTPKHFLPQVAECEISEEVDSWVIGEAFKQIQTWQESGFDFGTISINISADSINNISFIDKVKELLEIFPTVNPNVVEFEVLESSAISGLTGAHETLLKIQALGFRVAIDDFGTGYSSLALLRHLPINTLKIDQSFVRNMLVYRNDLSIVESVIRLAKAFRHNLIAEGVETAAHAEALLRLGCDVIQGQCVSAPIKASKVEQWLSSFNPESICGSVACIAKVLTEPSVAAAALQHRIWFNRLEQLMAGEPDGTESPLELDAEKCAFASWYQWALTEPEIHQQPQFRNINVQHVQIHETAYRLVDAVNSKDRNKAKNLMKALYSQQNTFLNDLASLSGSGLDDKN